MSGGAKALSGDRQLRLTACHLSSFSFTKQWPPAQLPQPPPQPPTRPPPSPYCTYQTSGASHALRYEARRKSRRVIHWLRQMWSFSHSPVRHTRVHTCTRRDFPFPLTNQRNTEWSNYWLKPSRSRWFVVSHTNTHPKRTNEIQFSLISLCVRSSVSPRQPATLRRTTSKAVKMSMRDLFQHCPGCGSSSKFLPMRLSVDLSFSEQVSAATESAFVQALVERGESAWTADPNVPDWSTIRGGSKVVLLGVNSTIVPYRPAFGHSGNLPSQVLFHSSGSSHTIGAVCARLNSASPAASLVHLIRMLKLSHSWLPVPSASPSSSGHTCVRFWKISI